MEIKITNLFDGVSNPPALYSNSIANSGCQNIGQITWNNAKANASSFIGEDTREEFEDWVKRFGAWEDEEIAAWSLNECNALLLQFIASEWREIDDLYSNEYGEINWEEVEVAVKDGQCSGNIFHGIDGEIYFSMF